MNMSKLQCVEERVGYTFTDKDLLAQAFTHSSAVDGNLRSNERLEFLGDAVLGFIVCAYLHETYTDLAEGEMTKIKSAVVSRRTCAAVAQELGFGDMLRLGKGMSKRRQLPESVQAATYEAMIGAVYLDGGLEAARSFILRYIETFVEEARQCGHQSNFKSVLQQVAQVALGSIPQYQVINERGPDHAKCFEIRVEIEGRQFPACWGTSKQEAEQAAALESLMELGYARREENGQVLVEDVSKGASQAGS